MQEVTCFNCRNVVRITPDNERCPVCGEDLRSRLSPRYVASYFCRRAEQMAADSPEAALAEAERGLAYEESSDLRLLGAILAEQLQRYDLMRKMAAAIPVGDSLRKEAEWLLRAHQDRQLALREAALQDRATQTRTSQAGHSFVNELLGPPAEPAAPAPRRGVLPAVVLTAVILVALGAGRWWWQSGGQPATLQADGAPASTTQAGAAPATVTVADTPPAEAPGVEQSAVPATVLPTPTAATPADVVAAPAEDSQVAQNTPPRAVVISADAFDLKTYLREVGRPDLALLPVRAQMQDGKLIVRGMVTLDIQRRELLETVAQAPGIDDINAVDLLLRPQPTYTVQEGDTLWTIVYDIYGNVDRLDEFFEFNRDVLPSPDAVSVGLVLQVPPQE